jgi:hypothetical protein
MLENSKDLLNIVSAISIATLVFFICWALYYVIASARRTFKLVKRIEQGVEKAESLIDLIKDKVSSSATYLNILSNLVKKGMDFTEKRSEKKREGSEKKKK